MKFFNAFGLKIVLLGLVACHRSSPPIHRNTASSDGTPSDTTNDGVHMCQPENAGAISIPDAAHIGTACSPIGTCLLLAFENGQTIARVTSLDGQILSWSILAQATEPVAPFMFVTATSDGFMSAVVDLESGVDKTYLILVDGEGQIRQSPILGDLNGHAEAGTQGQQTRWIASTDSDPSLMQSFHIAKVNSQAQPYSPKTITLQNANCGQIGGIAENNDVVAIAASWFNLQDSTEHVGLILKHGDDSEKIVPLDAPIPIASHQPSCDIGYTARRVTAIDDQFFVWWRNDRTNTNYAATVSKNGWIIDVRPIYPHITDIVPVSGGYLSVTHDQETDIVAFNAFNEHFVYQMNLTVPSTGAVKESPTIVTDGLNDGRFAIAWIDQDGGHAVFWKGAKDCTHGADKMTP